MAKLSFKQYLNLLEKYPNGMTTKQIVDFIKKTGYKFSEATFRKYVQYGFLIRSTRLGTKGKHRGSSGRYPIRNVVIIMDIKNYIKQKDETATLESLINSPYIYGQKLLWILGEVESIFDNIDSLPKGSLAKSFVIKKVVKTSISGLRKIADKMVKSL